MHQFLMDMGSLVKANNTAEDGENLGRASQYANQVVTIIQSAKII